MGCEAQGFREAETTDLSATGHSGLQRYPKGGGLVLC